MSLSHPLFPLHLPTSNSNPSQYFAFGKAIDTSRYGGYWENSEKCMDVYLEVKGAVEGLIQRLQVMTHDSYLPLVGLWPPRM